MHSTLPGSQNIYSVFEPTLKQHKDRVALQYFHKENIERVTFGELLDQVETATQRLKIMELQEGDRVAILIETSPCWAVAFLALMRLKLTAVLIDPTLPLEDTAAEIKYADVRCIMVSTQTSSKGIHTVFPDMPLILADHQFELVEKNKSPQQLPPSTDADSDVAVIIFTSGTSGQYKAVMLTHENVLQVGTCNQIVAMADNAFSILPWYHIAGLTGFSQVTLYGGHTLNFVEKLEADYILHAFQESKPGLFLGVPRFLELFYTKINNKINEQSFIKRVITRSLISLCGSIKKYTPFNPGAKIFRSVHALFGGRIKLFSSGGAALKPAIRKFFEALGFTIMLGYGLTETSGCVVFTDVKHKKIGYIGKPINGCKLKIDSPDGQGIGEICIQSPSVMKGYFRSTELTEVCLKAGWFHSGDIGHIDSQGNLAVDGRLKEVIVTAGGKKATPYEIEHHYNDILGISEIIVVGIPNLSLNVDEVYAAIIIDSNMLNAQKNMEQLHHTIQEAIFVRAGALPTQFRIQHIEFFDEFPRTSGMKKTIRSKIINEIQHRKKSRHVNHSGVVYEKMDMEHKKTLDSVIDVLVKVTSVPKHEIDPHQHFAEYGIDSLLALEIIQKLREIFNEDVVSPDKLLKNPTIKEFADDIVKRIHHPQHEKDQTTSIVPPRKIPTPAQLATSIAQPLKSDVIFLTGGTGVLGGYLTKLLLTDTEKDIYLLTRAATQEEAKQKLIELLKSYGTSAPVITKIDKRIHFVLGDVAQQFLGLSEQDYTELFGKIDTVIHAAGIVSLHGLYDSLVPVNVVGTKNVIDFTLKTKQKYMLYVSSYSIMGSLLLENNPAFTEQDFDKGQAFYKMGYQQTKFEAELLVRDASAKGLKWNVVRPGDIFGESKFGYYPLMLPQLTGIFYDILRTVIDTKVAVDSRVYFDMTPVDYVARGILYLCLQHPALYGTYHLTNPSTQQYTYVIKCLQNLGYSIEIVTMDEYMKRLKNNELLSDGKPYHSRTLELLQFNPTMAAAKESTHVDTTITRSILEPAGIICPSINEKLIEIYLGYCKKVGYLTK